MLTSKKGAYLWFFFNDLRFNFRYNDFNFLWFRYKIRDSGPGLGFFLKVLIQNKQRRVVWQPHFRVMFRITNVDNRRNRHFDHGSFAQDVLFK